MGWQWGSDAAFTRSRMLLVFQGVCPLWVLFRAPSLELAGTYFGKMLLLPLILKRAPGARVRWLVAVVCLQRPLAWTWEASRFARLPLCRQYAMAMAAGCRVHAYAGAKVDFFCFTV